MARSVGNNDDFFFGHDYIYTTNPKPSSQRDAAAADSSSVVKLTQTSGQTPGGRISPKPVLTVFLLDKFVLRVWRYPLLPRFDCASDQFMIPGI